MPIDLVAFGDKLKRCRDQFKLTSGELASATGILDDRLVGLELGQITPTGDEVLILADFFKCDYRFFISNERLAAFEQTESLYRQYGNDFSKSDRRRVQEFLFLCECEQFLLNELQRPPRSFNFIPSGKYFKGHAEQAADALRQHFSYAPNAVPSDVYSDFRDIGFHVFRRRLENSNISGLTIRHPTAGTCILVNYSEDIYRQRFTVAHEGGHGILDFGEDVVVSFADWKAKDLIEIRANTFASRYLLPRRLVTDIKENNWTETKIVRWANHFKISTAALAIALKEAGVVDEKTAKYLRQTRVPAEAKVDPELANLTERAAERKLELLRRGLSSFYVHLCFEAYGKDIVTAGRAAEMMLVNDFELTEIARLFNATLQAQ